MFSEALQNEVKSLEEEWRRRCTELYGGRDFKATTDSGIEVKPVYTPADIDEMAYSDIGLPGEYPFTRGHSPLQYQVEPWMMRFYYGYGTGEESRKRREFLEKLGLSQSVGTDKPASYGVAPDMVTQRGYDPDEAEARGRVGRDGTSISTMKDIEEMFVEVPLDEVQTMFAAHDSSMACMAMYIVYAERRGIPQHKLRMKGCNPIYRWWGDVIGFPPRSGMKLMAELMKYCTEFMPLVQVQALIGYNMGEAGGTAVQEIAFTLATAIAITEECIKVGLDPDDVASRFYSHDHVSLDFLEQIAKFRVKRRMWAKIFRERFGCRRPQSLRLTTWPQTGGSLLTAQEPLNNIVRLTIMTLASVLAGADGIWTVCYDEALGIPTEEAAQIALRTQQIIYHETNIPNVVDPLGGSYYLEWLTNRMEEEATKLVQEVEDLGGYIKCWEEGWFKRELERAAYEQQRKISSGEKVVVGLNKYRLPQQPKIKVFKMSAEVEGEIINRVRKFKAGRDNQRTTAALEKMKIAAQMLVDDWPGSCGCLMPAMIDAFRADATLGEVQRVLREVLGYGYVY